MCRAFSVSLWVSVSGNLLSAVKATFTKSRSVHASVFTEMNVKLPCHFARPIVQMRPLRAEDFLRVAFLANKRPGRKARCLVKIQHSFRAAPAVWLSVALRHLPLSFLPSQVLALEAGSPPVFRDPSCSCSQSCRPSVASRPSTLM